MIRHRIAYFCSLTPAELLVAKNGHLRAPARPRRAGPHSFCKEVVDPLRLPAHDWRICGLNVNRVNGEADSGGSELTGVAAAPATPA